MKIAWFVNIVFPVLAKELGWWKTNLGGWLIGQAEGLKNTDTELNIICVSKATSLPIKRRIDNINYYVIPHAEPGHLEKDIHDVLSSINPDVFHIFGTESDASFAAAKASDVNKTVISIQGLVSEISSHVKDGIPEKYYRRTWLKSVGKRLLHGSIIQDDATRLSNQGIKEKEILQKAKHVIGRTTWDKTAVEGINPNVNYYHCNEIFRDAFYDGSWDVNNCVRHTIFASQAAYPIKGFHQLLKAMPLILDKYPDTKINVAGAPLSGLIKRPRIKQMAVEYFHGYQGYIEKLVRENNLYNTICFLNYISEEQMKEQLLKTHVFVLPSNIENSPNSLGEAMILGVPCVASNVGGVKDLLNAPTEGFIYEYNDTNKLAEYICSIFDSDELALKQSKACKEHARIMHDPQKNTDRLLEIYQKIKG